MKKIILLPIIAIAISFTSCKKDRICNCTVTSGSFTTTQVTTMVKVTKKQAKANCISTIQSTGGITTTSTCQLS
ncbi:MAG: hypothetical protein SFY56_09265 [Bacteroidota bacterium]|nr:hypothetical protein [Bacteroidota bacterium]